MKQAQDAPLARKAIDWEDVRRRIAAAEAALAGLDEISTENLHKIWARRAAQLAKKPTQQDQDEQIELVVVQLGRELYGLDVRYVFDIKPLMQITRVPRVPNWVAGVVNLRGRILSVVDLRLLFGLPAAARGGEQDFHTLGAQGFLVVVETPAMQVALLCDDVLTVETFPVSQIQESSGVVRGLRPEYVLGVIERAQDGLLVILDVPALLADDRLIVHHVEII
jgi:purine-binding chemotaxis protein CheW